MTNKDTYTIDATGKRLGRVATEAAMALMGKHTPAFERHRDEDTVVAISGAGKLDLSERRREHTTYKRYSGHPGGQKIETMATVIEKKGIAEVIRIAVRGMLPPNKLRAGRLKKLVIEE